jgi:hypothetical protein
MLSSITLSSFSPSIDLHLGNNQIASSTQTEELNPNVFEKPPSTQQWPGKIYVNTDYYHFF